MADRIRKALRARADVIEKKVFGGLCFMVNGQMFGGLTKTDLMVRVGKEKNEDAISQPHARPMDFTGRPLAGMVYIDPLGYRTEASLAKWIQRGIDFVSSQPAKPKTRSRKANVDVAGRPARRRL